jgi:hypothetical protein
MKSGGHGGQFVKIRDEVDESVVQIYYPFPFQKSDYLRLAQHIWFDEGVEEFRISQSSNFCGPLTCVFIFKEVFLASSRLFQTFSCRK